MKKLNIDILKKETKNFCDFMSRKNHKSLMGVTDGKAIGTYVEQSFLDYLKNRYEVEIGNSSKGIDIPQEDIRTDIKVTSIVQPQSSCPFKSVRQKIFGLGYNLLIFVYNKKDSRSSCKLDFKYCTFIESSRTADYTITKRLRELIDDGANREDIVEFFMDRNFFGDEVVYNELAEEVLNNKPKQGYLTISNALQWRLQYGRVVSLDNKVNGILNYEW